MQLVKNIKWKKAVGIGFLVFLIAGLCIVTVGHSEKSAGGSEDILTQKPMDEKREPITILVKYAFTINAFEEEVEKKFPNVDIVQVGNFTGDMGIAEYESRLKNDDLTDIVMTWPVDVGEEYLEDRLLDLSGFDFTSKYSLTMLNSISQDGKLFYLPGPSQVRGIVYNKTLFEEKGWQVPNNFDEFVTLCHTIEETGIRSLQLGLENGEVLDTAFIGYSYADCYSQPEDTKWIQEYNEGQHKFGEHFEPALDTFQILIDEGILKKEDLNVEYSKREKMLCSRECAMVEDAVLLARLAFEWTEGEDEFALMPFFNPGTDNDWARIYGVCYIGMNKKLAEPANKDKYNQVLEIMEYISTSEGQDALMKDTGAMFSSLLGKEPSDAVEIEHMVNALKNGRYAVFNQLENAQEELRKGLAGMIQGTMTKEDVAELVDNGNASEAATLMPAIIGMASEDFSLIETGNFITDCMREQSGCEIALFLDNGKDGRYNGKGVSAKFYEGEITSTDIKRVLPDVKDGETGTLWKVTMTGEDLIQTMEHSIVVNGDQSGWFYYFSGICAEYNPSAEPGNRIKKITMADGSEIEQEREYTIAVMDKTVPEEFLKSCEKTEIKIADMLMSVLAEKREITPSKDGRFKVIYS